MPEGQAVGMSSFEMSSALRCTKLATVYGSPLECFVGCANLMVSDFVSSRWY